MRSGTGLCEWRTLGEKRRGQIPKGLTPVLNRLHRRGRGSSALPGVPVPLPSGALPAPEDPGEAGRVAGSPAGPRARRRPATRRSSHSHAHRKDRGASPVSPTAAGAARVRAGAHPLRGLPVARGRDAPSIPAPVGDKGPQPPALSIPAPEEGAGPGCPSLLPFLRPWRFRPGAHCPFPSTPGEELGAGPAITGRHQFGAGLNRASPSNQGALPPGSSASLPSDAPDTLRAGCPPAEPSRCVLLQAVGKTHTA